MIPLDVVGVHLTDGLLQPIADGIISNIWAVLPVCVGILAILLGVKIIPAIIARFTGMK